MNLLICVVPCILKTNQIVQNNFITLHYMSVIDITRIKQQLFEMNKYGMSIQNEDERRKYKKMNKTQYKLLLNQYNRFKNDKGTSRHPTTNNRHVVNYGDNMLEKLLQSLKNQSSN